MADQCPVLLCGRVGTEIVDGTAYCAKDAGRRRRELSGQPERPRRPDPLGMASSAQGEEIAIEINGVEASLVFNVFNEPVELRIRNRRWAVYPK
jgi:hypothetical protein